MGEALARNLASRTSPALKLMGGTHNQADDWSWKPRFRSCLAGRGVRILEIIKKRSSGCEYRGARDQAKPSPRTLRHLIEGRRAGRANS
jgi:hypothetical protein